MRIFVSGNEEVARYHLPVVQSKARDFAALTEKRGLKQNTFHMNFAETGARAIVSYCYGQLNVGISAPFLGGVEAGERVEVKRFYEWNKVADIDRVCRGDKGAMLGVNKCFICEFDAPVTVVEVGSISIADESIPESLRDGAYSHKMNQTERYISYIQDAFYAWRMDQFNYSFTAPDPVNVESQGLFADSFIEYGYTQLFRMDSIYVSGSPVMSSRLPSEPLNLEEDGTMVVYGTQVGGIVHDTATSPVSDTVTHPGTNMFDPQFSIYWGGAPGGAGGLWAGDYSPIAPMRGDAVAWFSGSTWQGALVNSVNTYDPPYNTDTDASLDMYKSVISLDVKIQFVDSNDELQTQTFRILDSEEISFPDFDALECVYSNHCVYTTLGNESTYTRPSGTKLKTGDYAYTLPNANIQHIGPHVSVSLVGATPTYNFFLRNGDTFSPRFLTNTTGYELKEVPQFGFAGVSESFLDKEIGVIEFSQDKTSFIACKYYEEYVSSTPVGASHHIGIYEFTDDGLGGATLNELMLFMEIGEAQSSGRKMFVWFSENFETIVLKGSAAHDGMWVKGSGAYTNIFSDMSGYTEPVYISRDGSVVAFKDKIYIDGELLEESPIECVGVFHTHDYYVDKISAAQFAIKDILGNIISTTQDGLYNFYEVTEDSSYALLSKSWWEEEDDKSTDVALVVGFADGPLKFETCDNPVLRQMDPATPRVSPRSTSTTAYSWPTTWCRIYAPGQATDAIYDKQNTRTLVSCREDGFLERAHNFTEFERVSAFLWHPELGLLQRLLDTVTIIPDSMLNQETRTPYELEA